MFSTQTTPTRKLHVAPTTNDDNDNDNDNDNKDSSRRILSEDAYQLLRIKTSRDKSQDASQKIPSRMSDGQTDIGWIHRKDTVSSGNQENEKKSRKKKKNNSYVSY